MNDPCDTGNSRVTGFGGDMGSKLLVNWLNAQLEGKLFTFFFQNSATNRLIIKYVKKY